MLESVRVKTALILILTVFGEVGVSGAVTVDLYGDTAMTKPNLIAEKPVQEWGSTARRNAYLSRGEATKLVVDYFQLEKKNAKYLAGCETRPEECLFSFSAMTNFHGLKTDPVVLYPDVGPAYRYYQAINTATLLDLVRGYYTEDESPFRPLQPISKVETLKLVLGASGLMGWKEKFELKLLEQQPNWLTASLGQNNWWYARYIAGATDNGLITSAENFMPEDRISKKEFLQLLESTNKIVAKRLETSQVDSGHSQEI